MASTIALLLTLVMLGALFVIGAVVGLSSYRAMKKEKSENFSKEHSPSTILVDTVGAIILREADKVTMNKERSRWVDNLFSYDYYFKYDNVSLHISGSKSDRSTSFYISGVDFSVGAKKNIKLTETEKEKLLQYVIDALAIKEAKIEAEKEKQRQLDACDALENLLKPETPKLTSDGSVKGQQLGNYWANNATTGTTSYYTSVFP